MEKLPSMIRFLTTCAFVLLTLTACGPGSDADAPEVEKLTVILDYLPGPIHAGFYAAQARGEYEAEGLKIDLRTPSSTSDTVRLMAAGQADIGLVPLFDYLNLCAEGREMKLLMAIVQTPLNAIIASGESGIKEPKDLEGKTIATTGILGDEITLKAVLRQNGGDPSKVETMNVGFNTIQALSSGQVDAAFGFWNSEGVQYAQNHDAVILRSFEQGIPGYPELVVFTSDAQLAKRTEAIERFLAITADSYEHLIANPEEALELFASSVDGYSVESARPFFEALLPVFKYKAESYGTIDPAILTETMVWLEKNGLPSYKLDLESLIAPDITLIAD
jgi:putative hydroxymethylpyrimidine transport system substrate-binding protein